MFCPLLQHRRQDSGGRPSRQGWGPLYGPHHGLQGEGHLQTRREAGVCGRRRAQTKCQRSFQVERDTFLE